MYALLGNTVAFAASIAYTTSSANSGMRGAKADVSPRLSILPSCGTIFAALGRLRWSRAGAMSVAFALSMLEEEYRQCRGILSIRDAVVL